MAKDDTLDKNRVLADIRRARANLSGQTTGIQAQVLAQIAQAEASLLVVDALLGLRDEIKQTSGVSSDDMPVTRSEMKNEIGNTLQRVSRHVTATLENQGEFTDVRDGVFAIERALDDVARNKDL